MFETTTQLGKLNKQEINCLKNTWTLQLHELEPSLVLMTSHGTSFQSNKK